VAITSGANLNFDRMRFVAERAETGEQREALLAVSDSRRARQLPALLWLMLGGRSITEFNYRISDANARRTSLSACRPVAWRSDESSIDCAVNLLARDLPPWISPMMKWPSCICAT
jgi:hypothetical protein